MYIVYYTKNDHIYSKEVNHDDLGYFILDFDDEHGRILSITYRDYCDEYREE